jgi:hypothetical protein
MTAAIGAVETMEEKMRLLTYPELTRYTKTQLWELHHQAMAALAEWPAGSPEHHNAMFNIHYIRQMLTRRDYAPR